MSTVEPIRKKSDLKKIEQSLIKSNNARDYLLFKMGINCGLRISDLLALNVGDVKNKNKIEIIEKKTQKKRVIALNFVIKTIINDYTKNLEPNLPLFRSFRGKRLERVSAYRLLKKICENLNIDIKIGTHTLRKTFGYHFYKKYNNIVMLQKIFNHSHPQITLRYIGIEDDEILRCYKNFIIWFLNWFVIILPIAFRFVIILSVMFNKIFFHGRILCNNFMQMLHKEINS